MTRAHPLTGNLLERRLQARRLMQIANVFICKQQRLGLFSTRWLDNKLILCGIALEILLMLSIVYTPWGNALFGTAPIESEVWLFCLPFAAGMLLAEELRKWLVGRFKLFPIKSEPLRLRKRPAQGMKQAPDSKTKVRS